MLAPFETPFSHAAFLGTFLRFLAFSVRRGVPMVEFLERFRQGHSLTRGVNAVLEEVGRAVSAGEPLTGTLDKYPDIFPPWLVAGIRAGERSGRLDAVAEKLGSLQSRRCHLLRIVERDWSYPLFLSGAILLLLVVLGVTMVPDFVQSSIAAAHTYPGFEEKHRWLVPFLDLYGSFRVGLSKGVLVAGLVVAGILTWVVAVKTRVGRGVRAVLRALGRSLPFYGRAQRSIAMAGFCDCVGDLLQSGVPLHEAIRMGAETIHDDLLRRRMLRAAQQMEGGEPIGTVLAAVPSLPHMFLFKVKLGIDETFLARSFAELSEDCRDEAATVLVTAQAVIQPFVILSMGAVVALTWFSVFYILFGVLGVLQEA